MLVQSIFLPITSSKVTDFKFRFLIFVYVVMATHIIMTPIQLHIIYV